MKPFYCFFLILAPLFQNSFASHNLGGQIDYEYLGNNNYKIILTTYTDPTASGVDRCTADIKIWKIGTTTTLETTLTDIPRQNGPPSPDPQFPGLTCNSGNGEMMGEYFLQSSDRNFKRNIYIDTVYLHPAHYRLTYSDMALYDNTVNVPNAGNYAFFVYTELNNIFWPGGTDNSPRLTIDTFFTACVNQNFINPNGWIDDDGDSMVFSAVPAYTTMPGNETGTPILGYEYPDVYGGYYFVGPVGDVVWQNPQQIGLYYYMAQAKEYRSGICIGSKIIARVVFVFPGCQITSANPAATANDFSVSPNPASDEFSIGIQALPFARQIHLFSMQGQMLRSEWIPAGAVQYRCSVQDLSAGVYLVQVEGQPWCKKIMVE